MSVSVEKSGSVWTVILSRPETRNAMDPATSVLLRDAFLEFEADSDANVAVLWGAGGAFCSGWDLKIAADLDGTDVLSSIDPGDWPVDQANGVAGGPMGPTRLSLSKPVIAAVAGPAVAGGMELALWCDLRVMEESAYFGVYCRRWGVPLIDGGTVRLPRLVGMGRAMDLVLTGRKVTAEESLRIGLCEYVVDDGAARVRAEELARQIAAHPQQCLRSDRQSLIEQHGLTVREAMIQEWEISLPSLAAEGLAGAAQFRDGAGRHGARVTP